MVPTDNEVPADLLARIPQEVPINSHTRGMSGSMSGSMRNSAEKLLGEKPATLLKNFRKWKAAYWSARPGSNRRPSAWECDEGRETALAFVLGVEIGVFKGS
jgi:hypothetical protein